MQHVIETHLDIQDKM